MSHLDCDHQLTPNPIITHHKDRTTISMFEFPHLEINIFKYPIAITFQSHLDFNSINSTIVINAYNNFEYIYKCYIHELAHYVQYNINGFIEKLKSLDTYTKIYFSLYNEIEAKVAEYFVLHSLPIDLAIYRAKGSFNSYKKKYIEYYCNSYYYKKNSLSNQRQLLQEFKLKNIQLDLDSIQQTLNIVQSIACPKETIAKIISNL